MKLFAFVILAISSANVFADKKSYLSVDVRTGVFQPTDPNWSLYYEESSAFIGGVAIGFKPVRFVEIGAETNYVYDSGVGRLPRNGILGGEVIFEEVPVSAYGKFRISFNDRQWFVPYASGGWTRITYRQRIKNQDSFVGHTQGLHYRVGVEVLLDWLDYRSARFVRDEYHIANSSFIIEYGKNRANKDSIELGGTTIVGGLRFDF